MCSDPMIRCPANGLSAAYFRLTAISPGISCSANSISFRPHSASERSATLKSNEPSAAVVAVAVVGRVSVAGMGQLQSE